MAAIQNEMDFATTRGRTGFDGDAEAGIAGEGAYPSKNGHLYKLKNNNNYELVAA